MTHYYQDINEPGVAEILLTGGIGVLRTDTIYGIVALALDQAAVERLRVVRKRPAHQRNIILIASQQQMVSAVPEYARKTLQRYWPGRVSIELPIDENVPVWLHCGEREISHRVPADEALRKLLAKTGPLIAPSANLQGEPPARSIIEAEAYFGGSVDFYVDGGIVDDGVLPSQLLRILADGTVERLR